MYKEINRTPLSENGSSIVQRVNESEGVFETLKETVVNSGEVKSLDDELTTIETIVITRKITKTEF